jgi:hypothetical protein
MVWSIFLCRDLERSQDGEPLNIWALRLRETSMDMWLTGWGQPFFLRRSACGKYDDGACNDVVYRATIKMRTIYGRP